MAARAYWKGSLKLSLAACPVMLYPATTSAAKTRFHKESGNRLIRTKLRRAGKRPHRSAAHHRKAG